MRCDVNRCKPKLDGNTHLIRSLMPLTLHRGASPIRCAHSEEMTMTRAGALQSGETSLATINVGTSGSDLIATVIGGWVGRGFMESC